jgi:hypothetical protein
MEDKQWREATDAEAAAWLNGYVSGENYRETVEGIEVRMPDDTRYLVLNAEGRVLYTYKEGARFQWDFTLPGPAKGGRVVDLRA